MLAACLCCRKKVPKNELLGLEGMVKLKNPDDPVVVVVNVPPGSVAAAAAAAAHNNSSGAPAATAAATSAAASISTEPNVSASVSFENEKRVSNAPHRSLPDIPVSDPLAAAIAASVAAAGGGSGQGAHSGDGIAGGGAGGSGASGGGGGGGDNGSDLYATVGDKGHNEKHEHERIVASNVRKLASISQHSSISQADDVSSPYARVKSMTNHAYDKLRTAEHPYAQVSAVGSSSSSSSSSAATGAAASSSTLSAPAQSTVSVAALLAPNGLLSAAADAASGSAELRSRRGSSESLLGSGGAGCLPAASHENIAAASAIAGRVSASQELPYMTPPIVQLAPMQQQQQQQMMQHLQPGGQQQQHFSGDSQDSSKGYTSISVREPLAHIIAQTKQQNAAVSAAAAAQRRRDMTDSHYATVSDDSDEMYAAIEDPAGHAGHADFYTSGSETYAQIQPPQAQSTEAAGARAAAAQLMAPITVAVEINTIGGSGSGAESGGPASSSLTPIGAARMDDDVLSCLQHTATSKRQSIISQQAGDDYHHHQHQHHHNHTAGSASAPHPPPVDSLRTVHSRQASSSSCTSSVGNLGSPKPEKRQANSPLPPTPKSSTAGSGATGSTNSGGLLVAAAQSASMSSSSRNSVASVIEVGMMFAAGATGASSRHVSRENLAMSGDGGLLVQPRSQSRLSVVSMTEGEDGGAAAAAGGGGAAKKRNSAKNLEGMYAKVMKKNKLSNAPSQNTSPVPYRKSYNDSVTIIDHSNSSSISTGHAHHPHHPQPPTITLPALPTVDSVTSALSRSLYLGGGGSSSHDGGSNDYETIDQRKLANAKDPEYETIPADPGNVAAAAAAASAAAAAASGAQTHKRKSTGAGGGSVLGAAAGLLAQGIQRVSHNSLTIFNEMASQVKTAHQSVASQQQPLEEPGYESLPDQRPNVRNPRDPGYETLSAPKAGGAQQSQQQPQLSRKPSSSDYDPNYEVLRHNNNNNHNNNNHIGLNADSDSDQQQYAKVWQTAALQRLDDENQLNDGYSSIRSPVTAAEVAKAPAATAAAASNKPTADFHDYAQIGERTMRRSFRLGSGEPSATAADPESSELYASITTVVERQQQQQSRSAAAADPNYSTISETNASGSLPAPVISQSPPTVASGGGGNNSSSNSSSSNSRSPSDSSVTPIEYRSMRNSLGSSAGTLAGIGSAALAVATVTGDPEAALSAYDSLTGSESDPNYERVRYTGATTTAENPYERVYSKSGAIPAAAAAEVVSGTVAAAVVVDDYFQV